jgi:hypothetical protein
MHHVPMNSSTSQNVWCVKRLCVPKQKDGSHEENKCIILIPSQKGHCVANNVEKRVSLIASPQS